MNISKRVVGFVVFQLLSVFFWINWLGSKKHVLFRSSAFMNQGVDTGAAVVPRLSLYIFVTPNTSLLPVGGGVGGGGGGVVGGGGGGEGGVGDGGGGGAGTPT